MNRVRSKIKVENPTLKTQKSWAPELSPGLTVEQGWAEGWIFHTDDLVTATHNDYETGILTVK